MIKFVLLAVLQLSCVLTIEDREVKVITVKKERPDGLKAIEVRLSLYIDDNMETLKKRVAKKKTLFSPSLFGNNVSHKDFILTREGGSELDVRRDLIDNPDNTIMVKPSRSRAYFPQETYETYFSRPITQRPSSRPITQRPSSRPITQRPSSRPITQRTPVKKESKGCDLLALLDKIWN